MSQTTEIRIAYCSNCGASFDAPPPINGLPVVLAQCGKCERRYYVSALAQPATDIALGDEAEYGFSPHLHLSTQHATDIESLLATLPYVIPEEGDRRGSGRVLAPIPLVVVPLDEQYHPMGQALNAASIDISISGISFVVNKKIEATYWLVDFGPEAPMGSQAIMSATRLEPNESNYWKIAGPFNMEIDTLGE